MDARTLYDDDIDRMRQDVMGAAYTDEQVIEAIGRMHKENGYLLDPHGAIAWLGLQEALGADRDAVGVFLATAHPAKFREVVEPAIGAPVALPSAQDHFTILRSALMDRGFAVASSSFSENGFALKDGAQRTH